jgi:hypothetical protein
MVMAVKDMIKAFRAYEKPFLVEDLHEPRRRRSDKEAFSHDLGYSSGGLGEDEHTDYLYATNRYRKCSFKQGFIWIRSKNKVLALMESIMRIEIRRIGTPGSASPGSLCLSVPVLTRPSLGFQTSHLSLIVRQQMHDLDDLQDRLNGLDCLEQRLSKIVGVRRFE